MGSLTPVEEWTQVTATTRVRGRDGRLQAADDLLLAGGGGLVVERDLADWARPPARAAASRRFSWVA